MHGKVQEGDGAESDNGARCACVGKVQEGDRGRER